MWDEFPFKDDLGGKDTGIDLVALKHDNEYWAVQCKFYQETTIISKGSVDSFLSTSSRTFKDENSKITGFSKRLWISTSENWGDGALEVFKGQNPPVSTISLSDLETAPVEWVKLEQGIHGDNARTEKKKLYPMLLRYVTRF